MIGQLVKSMFITMPMHFLSVQHAISMADSIIDCLRALTAYNIVTEISSQLVNIEIIGCRSSDLQRSSASAYELDSAVELVSR